MKLGILGGTFDPIHFGHLRTAEEIAQELDLEKVYLIPSASPPHKQGIPVTPFQNRLEMAELGVQRSNLLDVLDIESKRQGPSYSIETLKELSHTISQADFFFIVGMDAFLEIHTWKDYKDLFHYANFVVIDRPGFCSGEVEKYVSQIGLHCEKNQKLNTCHVKSGKDILFIRTTLMDISSTQIRDLVKTGKSIRYLVPNAVNEYIIKKGLYGKNERS